jgi:hypothetical protein
MLMCESVWCVGLDIDDELSECCMELVEALSFITMRKQKTWLIITTSL